MKLPFLIVASVLTSLVVASIAIADVIPYSPQCSPGQVAENHHGGGYCVGVPPKNCPVGWMGVRGTPMSKVGNCALRTCEDQRGCSDGLECKAADLCIEERRVEMLQRGSPVGARDAFFSSNLCSVADASASSSCAGAATCRASGVCLPKNVAKAAPRPSNWIESEGAAPRDAKAAASVSPPVTPPLPATASAPAAASITTGAPATSSSPGDAGGIDNTPKDTAPPRGGCSGCNTGASSAGSWLYEAGALACAIGALAFGIARRKRTSG